MSRGGKLQLMLMLHISLLNLLFKQVTARRKDTCEPQLKCFPALHKSGLGGGSQLIRDESLCVGICTWGLQFYLHPVYCVCRTTHGRSCVLLQQVSVVQAGLGVQQLCWFGFLNSVLEQPLLINLHIPVSAALQCSGLMINHCGEF